MNYRLLGRSGLKVAEIALGTMTFGTEWGNGGDYLQSRAMFDHYASLGGNFIDTANRYTEGTSESWLGEFLEGQRDQFVLATKYTLKTRNGDPNAAGNSRKNMLRSVEDSLKRLRTDYIDLLWVHAWDFMTPVDEVMRGLDDLVRAGKVLYIGISDTPAWLVARANTLAELRGWTAFVGLQIEYSLLQRTVERELTPMARALDLAVLAWAPLAGGALTGKYLNEAAGPRRLKPESKRLDERAVAITREVVAIAQELACPPAHVALAWLMQQQGTVIPIVGARSAEQLGESLAGAAAKLDASQMARLSTVSAIDLGFPHDFLSGDNVRDIVYAGTLDNILDRPVRN